jgi:glycosyltransferase involved in cell wall biosynthesis
MSDPRIQVLHLIDTYRLGGPGKTILNSARFIDQACYRIHVGSFTHADQSRNEFAAIVRDAGIPYLELAERSRFDIGHVRQLRRYVRDAGIGIVHAHGYRADVLTYVATAGFRDVARVTTHHGWIRNSRRQQWVARSAVMLARRFDAVACVSARLLDELPLPLRQSGRAEVVHNGIVMEDYVPRGDHDRVRESLGVAQDEVLLGVVGRLSAEKGCEEMLDAFRLALRHVPQLRLAFVGEGPLDPAIRAAASGDAEIHGAVQLLGHCHPVQPFFEAVDVVVSPSRTEGLSNVILEALTMRRPVVATRVGGNAEIIEHGRTGLLVPARDPRALSEAIVSLACDAGARARLAKAGYERIAAEFSFPARMRKEEAFYRRALERRGVRVRARESVSCGPV